MRASSRGLSISPDPLALRKNMGPRNRHCRAVAVRSELGYHEKIEMFAVDSCVDKIEHSLELCDTRMP